ncbi:hypothetical protein ACCO45_004085 [Purpureocillium lilacinum]|uniref:Uncharacterized protein n=1 Tax=Purpureocillium lilacinum TaxID=33203 RepID=A0ACC4E2P7_PURLI
MLRRILLNLASNASTSPSGPVVFASRPPATLVARPDSARWRNTPPCAAALGNQTVLGEDTRQDDKGPRRREPGQLRPSAVRRRDGAQRHREAARAEVLLAGSVDEGMERTSAQRAWRTRGPGARRVVPAAQVPAAERLQSFSMSLAGASRKAPDNLTHQARQSMSFCGTAKEPRLPMARSMGMETLDSGTVSARVDSKDTFALCRRLGGKGLDPRGLACIFARVEEGVWVPCLSQERSLHDSSVRLDSVSVEPSDRLLPSAAGGGGGGGAPSGSSWSVVVPSVCMCPVPLGMAHLDFNSRRRAAPPIRPARPNPKPSLQKGTQRLGSSTGNGPLPENAPGPLAMASKPAK